MEELVVQRRMLYSQLRAQEESHTFARATARSELQSVELAQQHATTHTRMEMAVSLEALGQAALSRAQAQLEVARLRTFAGLHRTLEAEQRDSVELQRHRTVATDALRMALEAHTEAERVR